MENLTTNNNPNFYWFFGCVEDRNDPLRLGRCRIRIIGYHTDDNEILPTEDLPWAMPVGPANSAGTSGVGWSPNGAVEGTWVVGFFADGENAQHPMFWGTVGSIPGGLNSPNCADGDVGDIPNDGPEGNSENASGSLSGLTGTQQATLELTLEKFLDQYGPSKIKNYGPLAKAQIMAQCRHESANFRTLQEYASGKAYEGRKDLGNTQSGDGVRFKGRGFIQITGRANYKACGKSIGVDLVSNPVEAQSVITACKIVLWYFTVAQGRLAAKNWGDVVRTTELVNGGRNGLTDRKNNFVFYKKKYGA